MMTLTHLLDTFSTHDFLQSLNDHQRMILASGAQPFKVENGKFLFREGEPATVFYLLQSGEAHIECDSDKVGPATVVDKVGTGDVVGWSWVLPPHRWRFNCRATTVVQGILFNAAWLRDLCETDCYLGYLLMKKLLEVVARRFTACRSRCSAGLSPPVEILCTRSDRSDVVEWAN